MPENPSALPDFTTWPSFPFEGDFRVKDLDPPVDVEPPRSGEDGVDCVACHAPDYAYIWVSERWRVKATEEPPGLPVVLVLESRSHLDLGDLPNLHAAELGVMTVRLERAIRSLDGVGRVHVNRWGDGSAHLHLVFQARPYGRMQLRGSFLSLWEDMLPPVPLLQWQEDLGLIAAWLAEFGGQAIAEPPHIAWQAPGTMAELPDGHAAADAVGADSEAPEVGSEAPEVEAAAATISPEPAQPAAATPAPSAEPAPSVGPAPSGEAAPSVGPAPSEEAVPSGNAAPFGEAEASTQMATSAGTVSSGETVSPANAAATTEAVPSEEAAAAATAAWPGEATGPGETTGAAEETVPGEATGTAETAAPTEAAVPLGAAGRRESTASQARPQDLADLEAAADPVRETTTGPTTGTAVAAPADRTNAEDDRVEPGPHRLTAAVPSMRRPVDDDMPLAEQPTDAPGPADANR